MTGRIIGLIFCAICIVSSVWSQKNPSDILFTVDGQPVTVGEFDYIYSKSKGDRVNYSKASVEEYLDLYTKFKLKVRKARDLQLDTIPVLKKELEGYRKQLASTYLLDKEVLDDLTKEAYDRLKYDVSISHIFFFVPKDAGDLLEKEVYNRAKGLKDDIIKGKIKFEEAAKNYSEDEPTGKDGGFLGYITAFYLKNFYQIENVAYTNAVGSVSEPVRSKYGYHLVKINDKRPARGEMEAAHIMIKVEEANQEGDVQARIRKIYKEVEGGLAFADAAKKYSEDETTAMKGGYLGVVAINKYEKAFEETIFRLEKDGDFSVPFRSSVGWHIVQRVKKKELGSYDEMQRGLKARVQRDGRFQIVQEEFIKKIKKENNFKEVESAKNAFTDDLDQSFLTLQWKSPLANAQTPLFTIGAETTTSAEFVQYLAKNANTRARQAESSTAQSVFNELYERFVGEKLMEYEESQLPVKYPEFKSLMREYEEGILLFEATNTEVWGKAAKDTIGLANFYEKNKKNYLWAERVEVTTYKMSNEHPTLLAKARKLAKKKSSDKVLAKINTDAELLTAETKSYEKGQNEVVDALEWKKKAMSENDLKGDAVSFVKIETVIKPEPKSFADARGYIIADYQNYLEEKWMEDLRKVYEVKINEEVLKGLIKN